MKPYRDNAIKFEEVYELIVYAWGYKTDTFFIVKFILFYITQKYELIYSDIIADAMQMRSSWGSVGITRATGIYRVDKFDIQFVQVRTGNPSEYYIEIYTC